ncbi:LCP family protein [Actinoplanes sp. KI2]|uniref:LCP family protein n=1 Tax=Actinoplanes sp. KI2 TaxID=2983315 RepID=UPI0021D5F484|nr:LCP family protein [Actinoplanes sp. KI2]MCU7730197.1 LCP family protein [Actinoplanes sp. KI2]
MPKEPRDKRRKSPLWAKVSLTLGAVLVVLSGGTIAIAKVAEGKVNNALGDHKLPPGLAVKHAEIKGAKNILLASLDTRPSWSKTHLASHTDSIIILHIAADHRQAYMLSVPRDTLVDIPQYNNGKYRNAEHHDKINSAFAFGSMGLDGDEAITQGMALLTKTIQQQFGITPDAEAVVNYSGFTDIMKILGKVCMNVDENVTSIHIGHDANGKQAVPYITDGAGIIKHKVPGVTPNKYTVGNHCFTPAEALDFARQRDLLAKHDGDYGRQRHQQQLLKAILKTSVSEGLNSPTKLPSLLTAIGRAMTVFRQGISLEDWAFGMRNVNPDTIITLKTNAGKFNPVKAPPGVGSAEGLTPDSLDMFRAAKDDTMAAFVTAHPTWIAST